MPTHSKVLARCTEGTLGPPSSALFPFFWGRGPLLRLQKQIGYPYSNLSTGGPSTPWRMTGDPRTASREVRCSSRGYTRFDLSESVMVFHRLTACYASHPQKLFTSPAEVVLLVSSSFLCSLLFMAECLLGWGLSVLGFSLSDMWSFMKNDNQSTAGDPESCCLENGLDTRLCGILAVLSPCSFLFRTFFVLF